MRILLTGKDGQLGFELERTLRQEHEVIATGRAELDLANLDELSRRVRAIHPDIVINTAAYTAVDRAEDEPEIAFTLNARAPGTIAATVKESGALLIHYSTDYVFDGKKSGPYEEIDVPHPLGAYGKSKLAGESAIAASGARYLILRTSWLYGVHGSNFAKTILRIAKERDALKVVCDQRGAPTCTTLVADATRRIVENYGQTQIATRAANFPFGTYHIAAAGDTTWHAYAKYLVAAVNKSGTATQLRPENIEAVTAAQYGAKALRPANSRLDTRKFTQTFGISLPPWQSGVDEFFQALK